MDLAANFVSSDCKGNFKLLLFVKIMIIFIGIPASGWNVFFESQCSCWTCRLLTYTIVVVTSLFTSL